MTFSAERTRALAQLQQTTELSEGLDRLDALIASLPETAENWNEAQTRFHILDRLLIECLGYPRSQIEVEGHEDGDFADYEIGRPKLAIWEAKREGSSFEVPCAPARRLIRPIRSLSKVSEAASEAILQVNRYCQSRNVEVAVAANGHQIIAFISQPVDLTSELQGNAILFESLPHLRDNFGRAWQLLSYPALCDRRLKDLLRRSETSTPPEKLSSSIPNYPQHKARTSLEASLKTIGELLLLNIDEQSELEQSFFEECYADSGALSQDSLVSKSILAARYASLFELSDSSPTLSPVREKRGRDLFTPDLLADAISSKPIVLLGDVGVGKSSFIKHLKYVSAYEEFRRSIYVYVNLGQKAILSHSLNDVVMREVENTLLNEHGVDILARDFIEAVYKSEIKRFDKGIHGAFKGVEEGRYTTALIDFLEEKTRDRAFHLKQSIQYLSKEKKKQIIVAIDNADQRDDATQQQAFLIAQSIAANWKAAVFISMRPATYYKSKRSGTLAAYQNRVFTIAPPRVDVVLEKRIRFALDVAQGRRQLETLSDVSLNLSNIAAVFKVLLPSIGDNAAVKAFLDNISGGNIREIIEFVANLIGSPNLETDAMIRGIVDTGEYYIPIYDFWKVALRGDFVFFDPTVAFGTNVFDTVGMDKSEHFLMPLILGYLDHQGIHRSRTGFVATDRIQSEMQSLGFTLPSVDVKLRRLNNDKLIETSSRVTFEEDEAGLSGIIPTSFRLTTRGAYYLKSWMLTFPYLDAVVVDVPIFDLELRETLREDIRSLSLPDRYDRAIEFRDYLRQTWEELSLSPEYLDFRARCEDMQWTFDKVRTAVSQIRHEESHFAA